MKNPLMIMAALVGIVLIASVTATTLFSQKIVSSKTKSTATSGSAQLHTGDIIFQSSTAGQSLAIQMATHSPYSHCGIITQKGDKTYVYEAVGPVKLTPLDDWKGHGDGEHYVVKRLKNADKILTPDALKNMQAVADRMEGKPYDIYFEWSDDKIYCSELVWKIYKEGAGIEIGKLQKLKDFDLSSPQVRTIMQQRYGNNPPLDETVVSPSGIFDNPELVTVLER